MDVSFVVLLDEHGNVVQSRFMDLDLGVSREADERMVEAIAAAKVLQKPGDPHGKASGFIRHARPAPR